MESHTNAALVATGPNAELLGIESVEAMTRDIAKSGELLSHKQARFMVDCYYDWQRNRIRAQHQAYKQLEGEEPSEAMEWLFSESVVLEKQMVRPLTAFAKSKREGRWLLSICGIGPIIAAGMLCHVRAKDFPHSGHLISFAGLRCDYKTQWRKGQKRPWNARLKTLLYKAGESFVKVQGRKSDFYGKHYAKWKNKEWDDNTAGKLADVAERDSARYDKKTDAYLWTSGCFAPEHVPIIQACPAAKRAKVIEDLKRGPGEGLPMLPPSHIHARARRKVMKLFLEHTYQVFYESQIGGEPPEPYVFEHLGHSREGRIPPPNWPME